MAEDSSYSGEVARVYDLLVYGHPDAEAQGSELDFLLRALEDACRCPVRDVLDVGCGTGYHLLPLVRRGYGVRGVDCSSAMLAECRRKLRQAGLRAELGERDMRDIRAEDDFDTVLAMNSVLCYVHRAAAVRDVLGRLHRALRPGGLLVLDNWNLLAQWYRLEEDYGEVRRQGGVCLEYRAHHWMEDFAGIYHVEIEATVTEDSRSYGFRSDEALKVMTVDEVLMHLASAGFGRVAAYPSYDLSLQNETSGDRMIFLAHKPP